MDQTLLESFKHYVNKAIDDSGGYEYGSSDAAYYTANGLSLALNILEEVQRRDSNTRTS